MTEAPDGDGWRDALAAVVARAPDALRALASAELYIGGFTNVRLEHPLLDLRAVAEDALAARALAFFVAGAVLAGAEVARVHAHSGAQGAALARRARRSFKAALVRIDDENVGLLRYFDLYFHPAAALDGRAGAGLVRTVERALDARG